MGTEFSLWKRESRVSEGRDFLISKSSVLITKHLLFKRRNGNGERRNSIGLGNSPFPIPPLLS